MKWFKIGLLAGLIIATAVGFTFMRSPDKGYKFYYYPQLNAYYDVQNETYFYSIDGAKTWDTITRQSDALPNNLGKKIIIYSDVPQAWLQNQQHREKYGGMLNDLIGNSVIESKKNKVAKRKRDDTTSKAVEGYMTKEDSMEVESDYLSSQIRNDEHAAQADEEDSKENKQAKEPSDEEKVVEEEPHVKIEVDSTDLLKSFQ